jgi:hypothetical protein
MDTNYHVLGLVLIMYFRYSLTSCPLISAHKGGQRFVDFDTSSKRLTIPEKCKMPHIEELTSRPGLQEILNVTISISYFIFLILFCYIVYSKIITLL